MMVARSGQVWAGYCGRGACMLGTDAGDCLKLRDAGLCAILWIEGSTPHLPRIHNREQGSRLAEAHDSLLPTSQDSATAVPTEGAKTFQHAHRLKPRPPVCE